MTENVVYVLGAGFSHDLGLPLMSDFLSRSKDLYAAEKARSPDTSKLQRQERFSRVFAAIDAMARAKTYYSANMLNIEEILSILEMGDYIDSGLKAPDFRAYICDVIEALTPPFPRPTEGRQVPGRILAEGSVQQGYLTFVTCLLGRAFVDAGGTTTKNTAQPQGDRSTNYSVVSLNYDRILETLASSIGGIVENPDEVSFDVFPGARSRDATKPLLAKLHGSSHTPATIIPPTWNKGRNDDIAPAWCHAFEALRDANHLRFVGYSLPVADSYVKYLLKYAVIDCFNLKSIDVICLDPDGSVERRYNEFIDFPNLRFANATTREYVVRLLGYSLPNAIHDFDVHLEGLHSAFMSRAAKRGN